jgi:hypothetical protein
MSNDFVPSNNLELALVNAATNPATRPDFYRQLVESDLLFLTSDAPDAPQFDDGQIEFLSWEGPRGPYVPCFTSVERIQEVAERPEDAGRVVQLGGRQAFELLAQLPCEAFLNPGLGYGKRFVAKEIRRLADGTIFEAVGRLGHEVSPVANEVAPETEMTAPAAMQPSREPLPFEPTIAEPRRMPDLWDMAPRAEEPARPDTRPTPRGETAETPRPRLSASPDGRPSPMPSPGLKEPEPEPAPPPRKKPWWKFW